MRNKILLGTAMVFGFIVAATGVAVITSLVNVLIPNPNKADPPGAIEESAEDKSKREWKENQKEDATATKKEDKEAESVDAPSQQDQSPEAPAATTSNSTQSHEAPPRAPTPTIGPGNFDAPPAEGYFNTGQGPGNM